LNSNKKSLNSKNDQGKHIINPAIWEAFWDTFVTVKKRGGNYKKKMLCNQGLSAE